MTIKIDRLLSFLAPHNCICCGNEGLPLCAVCQEDLHESQTTYCHNCNTVTKNKLWCRNCQPRNWLSGAWVMGNYESSLKELIKTYKFDQKRAAAEPLAHILDEFLPLLPLAVTVTTVPAARPHVRQRGFDHTALLAKTFADLRGLTFKSTLNRCHNLSQLGADKKQRQAQAKAAFKLLNPKIDGPVLLLDDVVTTGSTILAAADLLHTAGAQPIFVAALAQERLK